MADVSRGQLILITGLVLAVGFVALTLLLNTVIYTENLASRGTEFGAGNAIEFRAAVSGGVGGLLDAENDVEHPDHAAVRENVSEGVDVIDRRLARYHASEGAAAEVTNLTLHDGALLRDVDGSRNMSSSAGTRNWTLATDVEDTRGFVVNVTGGLDTSGDPDRAFNVSVVDAGGARWSLAVYESGGTTTLAVTNGSGATNEGVCSPSAEPRIDLTAGEIDGEACSAIEFAKGVSPPYDIEYTFADRATGTYNLTVNTTGGASVESSNFHATGGDSPYEVPAVYSAAFDLHYETAGLEYHARIRVAPGEPA